MSAQEVRNRTLELELARANSECDAQRAAAEQKAQEAELQAATLRQNVEALEARAAEVELKEAAIVMLTDTLVQKDVLLET